MSKIFAICTTLDAGSEYDQGKINSSGIRVGDKIELETACVGAFHTDIYLVGYEGSFNSVFFDFEDENGDVYDIYQDEKFWSHKMRQYGQEIK